MKIKSSKEVYRCKLFHVTEDEASDGKGWSIERCIVRHPGSAVMLAVDKKKRVLLVRQYRLPAADFLWEIPAGKLDKGETPIQAAKRELIEETGYRAKKWEKLTEFYPSPGYVGEKMTVFLATGLTAGEAQPMEDERIEIKWFSKKEITTMIRSNSIVDAKTMIAYLHWAKL